MPVLGLGFILGFGVSDAAVAVSSNPVRPMAADSDAVGIEASTTLDNPTTQSPHAAPVSHAVTVASNPVRLDAAPKSSFQSSAAIAHPDSPTAPEPLMVIGVTGLTWNDISPETTPSLWALAGANGAAVGNLLVRSVRAGSCPAEGWLALNTGRRTGEVPGTFRSDMLGVPSDCLELAEPQAGLVPAWADIRTANTGAIRDALGSLNQWLAQMDLTAAAVGPGAAIALADPNGQVGGYAAAPVEMRAFEQTVRAAVATGVDLVVVDAGSRSVGLGPTELDQRIGVALAATEGPVVVASLADFVEPALAVLVSRGLETGGTAQLSLIGSVTTHRPELSHVAELHSAIQATLLPAPVGPVTPWRLSAAGQELDPAIASLRDQATHAEAMRSTSMAGLLAVIGLAGVGLVGGLLALARRQRPARWEAFVLVTASFPVAGLLANLVPWWRTTQPFLVWVGVSLMIAALLAVVVFALSRGPSWSVLRSPMGAPGLVGLITAGVLVADPLVDQRFTWAAPMGTPVLNVVRLYGLGNPVMALFTVAVLVTAVLFAGSAWLKGRSSRAAVTCLVLGLAATIFLGAPQLGASFGGAITMAAGATALVWLASDTGLTWRLVLGVGLIALLAGAAVLAVDYLRGPEHWTHLGAFAEQLLNGEAWPALAGKAAGWLRLSIGAALIFGLAYVAWRVARRRGLELPGARQTWRSAPMMRPIGLSVLIALVIGSLVNDSGLVVAGIGACLAGPLLAAALLRGSAPTIRGAMGQARQGE